MKRTVFFVSVLLLCTVDLFACSGDCIKCHPVLTKNNGFDQDHKILNSCKQCHIDGTQIATQKDPLKPFIITKKKDRAKESHVECGADCWQCHDIKKVALVDIQEHKELPKCIKCHTTLDKQLFSIGEKEGFEIYRMQSVSGYLFEKR